MNIESAPTRYKSPSPWLRWVMCLLAASAIAISSMLLFKSMTGSALPGCSAAGTFDCDSVLATRWSHVLGVPVSAPAIALYLAVLVAIQLSTSPAVTRRRMAWRVLIILAFAILGAAAWFIALQVRLGSYCLYCMIAHAAGSLLALALLITAPIGQRRINPDDTAEPADAMMIPPAAAAIIAMLGLCFAASLVVTQILIKPPSHAVIQLTQGHEDIDTGKAQGKDRTISILGTKVRLKPYDYPMMGSPDADHIVVYLFDYTCPNCRAMHHEFEKAVADLHGQLGVVMLAVPLDSQCNPYVEKTIPMHQSACALAQLSTAVFLANRDKFHEYDQWLSTGAQPPGVEKARAKAIELVGEKELDAQLARAEIDQRIKANITVYGMTGGSVVPQFVMGNVRIFSRPDPEALMELFKTHLGIEP